MSLTLLLSTIEKEVEKTESKIQEKIIKLSQNTKITIDLEEYSILEKTLELCFSSDKNNKPNGQINTEINDNININQINEEEEKIKSYIYQKKKYLKILRKNLFNKFIQKDIKRYEFLHKLNQIIYTDIFPNTTNIKEIILNSGKNKSLEENQNIDFYKDICNKIIQNNYDIVINKLNESYISAKNIEKIPNLLLYDFKEIIKQKIFIEWSLNYRVLLKDLILSDNEDPDFKYLYNIYHYFFNDKLTLFDDKYLFKISEEKIQSYII